MNSVQQRMQLQKEARERVERIRVAREQWRAERLHDMAVIFERAFTAERAAQ